MWETFSQIKTICIILSTLTLKELKYPCLHDKFSLLMRRRSLSEEREIVIKELLEKFGPYIYRKCLSKDEYFITLMKLRLDFLFTDLSQHLTIYIWWSFYGTYSNFSVNWSSIHFRTNYRVQLWRLLEINVTRSSNLNVFINIT